MSISETDLYAANIAVHYKSNALHCKEFYGKLLKPCISLCQTDTTAHKL